MLIEYIEQRDGGYYVAGTRISFDSVVYSFRQGNSPERILEQFPLLDKLANVYGAITFYLDHKFEIDHYIEDTKREFEASGIPMEQSNPFCGRRFNGRGPGCATRGLEYSVSGRRRF